MSYIVEGRGAAPSCEMGGKARGLAELAQAGFLIPEWFVVTPDALLASLPAGFEVLAADDLGDLSSDVLASLKMPPKLIAELLAAVQRLSPDGTPLAVRSSAIDEDGERESFAGQLDSFLNVTPPEIASAVAKVWRSAYGERVLAYRRARRLPPPRPPAVLIQRMVDAQVSGVAFSADPVSGNCEVAVVVAVLGSGAALVSGGSDADTFRVDRAGHVIERRLGQRPSLADAQATMVAEMARRSASCRGQPQDIEWAFEDGQLYLLQSRAITALDGAPEEGAVVLWDNSNISESYAGVTTPLTFSFVRYVYEEVYREFCRLLKVPQERLEAHDQVFRNMLGLIQGRVYYNLLNWYRALALLPGFRMNRRFMEQMMGVREGLPGKLVEELATAGRLERWRDAISFCRSAAALVWGHFTIESRIRAFRRRFEQALNTVPSGRTVHSPRELTLAWRELERRLLKRWDAPLLNDFLAMSFLGVLGKLTRAWCADSDGSLQNELLRKCNGMVSAEPARQIHILAKAAAASPQLTAALCGGSRAAVEAAIEASAEFKRLYIDYLERFADRCPGELKLESLPLDQDPLPLFNMVGQLAHRQLRSDAFAVNARNSKPKLAARERVKQALKWRPLRSLLFGWVLKHARGRMRDRENLRYERTRLFGKVRHIFSQLGMRFHEAGVLDHPRDIFYLEANEAWGFVDGTATCPDLKGLVTLRKAVFDLYRAAAPPPARFETTGCVPISRWRERFVGNDGGEERQGLGCCAGVVRGPVHVVRDPRAARLDQGEILVAERTDPGWVILFPAAAGILVERGSLLSHAAVVTRELGIPSVVSVPGLTAWLRDGDWVQFDGATGVVTRIPSPLDNRTFRSALAADLTHAE